MTKDLNNGGVWNPASRFVGTYPLDIAFGNFFYPQNVNYHAVQTYIK